MYLINKQNILVRERRENRCKVPWSLDSRTRGTLESHPQLARDDPRQRGLTETWRSMKKNMVERISPTLCGVTCNLQIAPYVILSDVIVEATGTKGNNERLLIIECAGLRYSPLRVMCLRGRRHAPPRLHIIVKRITSIVGYRISRSHIAG
jgi:hypothetical protein